jgi:hypothetical protein
MKYAVTVADLIREVDELQITPRQKEFVRAAVRAMYLAAIKKQTVKNDRH